MVEIKTISELLESNQMLPGDEGSWLIPYDEIQKYEQEDLEELQASLQREATDRGLDLLFQYDIDYNQYRVSWRPRYPHCLIEDKPVTELMKDFIEKEVRAAEHGLIQLELGLPKDEALALLRGICTPLAEELGYQIWANKWPFAADVWVIKWRPNPEKEQNDVPTRGGQHPGEEDRSV